METGYTLQPSVPLPRGLLRRFNIAFALVFVATWIGSSYYFSRFSAQLTDDMVIREARMQMDAAMAVREYTQEMVKGYFAAQKDDTFVNIEVPAFAAIDTMRRLHASQNGYSYREVSLNPTNEKNRAIGWEATQLMRSAVAKGPDEVTLVHDGERAVHAVKPVRVSKAACLGCHGKKEEAPRAMVKQYGGNGGFGWNVGDVVAIQIATVPKAAYVEKLGVLQSQFRIALAIAFVVLFVATNLAINGLALAPLLRRGAALEQLANKDSLTGALNRRAYEALLSEAIAIANVGTARVSVLVVDVDHFKRVNDLYGHAAGDEVLRQVSASLRRALRSADCFGRLGGEEFGAVLTGAGINEAADRAEQLRRACHGIDFPYPIAVTVSIGVAEWKRGDNGAALLARADGALYVAKSMGRDRVAIG